MANLKTSANLFVVIIGLYVTQFIFTLTDTPSIAVSHGTVRIPWQYTWIDVSEYLQDTQCSKGPKMISMERKVDGDILMMKHMKIYSKPASSVSLNES